jgi:1-acyl-sn-glycerol-3-phosphate acyltransferase
MRALRFIAFNLLSWVTVIPFAILVLVVWPFGHRYAYFFAKLWSQLVLWLASCLCGLTFRVTGEENIPAQGCVFFVKHSSAFETFGSLSLFPRNCWVLKRELLWVPFFGWTLIPLDSIAIDRSKGSEAVKQVVEQGSERLARGINVVVFPEGTRMPVGTTKRYGISGMLLAQQAGAPIIPVAHNAGYFWPRRGLGIRPGEITVVIGKPVYPEDREPRQVNQEIQDWVEAEVAKLVPESE